MRAFFGHHKCGSTWIWQLMSILCREVGLRHYMAQDEYTPYERTPLVAASTADRGRERAKGSFERSQLRRRAEEAGADVVSCITADLEQLDALAPELAFHVIRDPRDIIVSGYFSHRNAAPADHPGPEGWGLPHIAEHRERLLSASKEEGLLLEMEFARVELLELAEWDYERPNVLEVRLEELAARPYDGFVRIFQHLDLLPEDEPTKGPRLAGIWTRRALNRICSRPVLRALQQPMPLTGEILLGAVYANRFEAKTKGRRAGAEDTTSHYRKGVAGDWMNHFTDVHVEAFEERFPGLTEKLGYESSPSPAGLTATKFV
jgi:Sulfotransferase domain